MKKIVIIALIFLTAGSLDSCREKNSSTETTTDQVSGDTSSTTTATTNTDQNETPATTDQKKSETPNNMLKGTVMLKGDSWIIRGTNEASEMKDYFPSNLSEEFRVEGLKVQFQGVLGEIPPNVRMVGAPITLTEIEKAE